ncbi:hypothetical protein [Nitratireductor soli]|uniref:hypothetical protein n=1 Tax=Nitratireductor soli TaxID=1670619 RepID=UPI003CC7AD26
MIVELLQGQAALAFGQALQIVIDTARHRCHGAVEIDRFRDIGIFEPIAHAIEFACECVFGIVVQTTLSDRVGDALARWAGIHPVAPCKAQGCRLPLGGGQAVQIGSNVILDGETLGAIVDRRRVVGVLKLVSAVEQVGNESCFAFGNAVGPFGVCRHEFRVDPWQEDEVARMNEVAVAVDHALIGRQKRIEGNLVLRGDCRQAVASFNHSQPLVRRIERAVSARLFALAQRGGDLVLKMRSQRLWKGRCARSIDVVALRGIWIDTVRHRRPRLLERVKSAT